MPDERPAASLPDGTLVYAIGDIHGCIELFEGLRRAIAADATARPASRRLLVHLGDYLGRGRHSRGVVDMLIDAPLPGFQSIHLKGNHEDLALRFWEGDLQAGRDWLANGGVEALISYGIDLAEVSPACAADLERLQHRFRERMPRRHIDFLHSLALSFQVGGYLFVHAGLRPGVRFADQTPRDMMWIRRRFLESGEDFGAVVVHGHSVTDAPAFRPNRIALDTGAPATGRLTALALHREGWTVIQAWNQRESPG